MNIDHKNRQAILFFKNVPACFVSVSLIDFHSVSDPLI